MSPKLLLIGVFLLLPAAVAFGCLNDRETINTEREFRSRYESSTNPGSSSLSPAPAADAPDVLRFTNWSAGGIALSAVGLLLVLASIKIARRKLAPVEWPA